MNLFVRYGSREEAITFIFFKVLVFKIALLVMSEKKKSKAL